MNAWDDEEEFIVSPALRRAVYVVLILSTLAMCAGRVSGTRSKDGRGPFHSANDRSRWCTVRNLVERNNYTIDRFEGRSQW